MNNGTKPVYVDLGLVSSASPSAMNTKKCERFEALERMAEILTSDPTARFGPMDSVTGQKQFLLHLKLYHKGRDTLIVAAPHDVMQSFFQFASTIVGYDSSLAVDDDWDRVARGEHLRPATLVPSAKALLDEVHRNRKLLVAATLAIIETGEANPALRREHPLAAVCVAIRKLLAGDGPLDKHLALAAR